MREDGGRAALVYEVLSKKVGPEFVGHLAKGSGALRIHAGITAQTVEEVRKLQDEIDALSATYSAYNNSVIGDIASAANKFIDFSKRVRELSGEYENGGPGAFLFALAASYTTLGGKLQEQKTFIEGVSAARRVELDLSKQSGQAILNEAKAIATLNEANARIAAERAAEDEANKKSAASKRASQLQSEKQAVDSLIESLVKERDALLGVSEQEQALRQLAKNKSQDNAANREKVSLLTAQIQAQKQLVIERENELKVTERQIERDRERRNQREEAALRAIREDETNNQTLRRLTGQADDDRKIRERELLEAAIARGEVNEEQALRAVKAIAGITDETEKANEAAEEFGLVIASAIGEFAKNPNAKTFLDAIGRDILALTTKFLIMEPIAKRMKELFGTFQVSGTTGGGFDIGGLFASLFGAGAGAAGGSAFSGAYYGGSGVAFAAGTDSVPRTGFALVHQGERIIPAGENRRRGAARKTSASTYPLARTSRAKPRSN